MENKRLLTPGEMKRINDGTPPEYRYGDVFQLIAKAQYPLAYQDGSEATADAFIEAGKEIAAREIVAIIEEHCRRYQWRLDSDTTNWHYPFCPTDFKNLKSKYNI